MKHETSLKWKKQTKIVHSKQTEEPKEKDQETYTDSETYRFTHTKIP